MLPQHLVTDIVYGRTSGDVVYTNRLFWNRTVGTVTAANMSFIADQAMAVFAPLFADVLVTSCSVFGVNARWIGSDNDFEGSSTDTAVAGAISLGDGEILPESSAVVIRRRTGYPGRDKRGRIFVGLVPEGYQDAGRLTAEGITQYKGIANKIDQNLIVAGPGLTFEPVTPSYKTNQLIKVTQSQLVIDVLTRRDRALPKKPLVSGVIGI